MSNNNIILKNREKGVSLIVTFFILTIILAVVLGISMLLYNGIKIIRNVGNSVVAFYAADSGVEKVLYYDRREIPAGAVGGICNICASGICPDCVNCSATPNSTNGCAKCTDCHVSFNTNMTQSKYYNVVVDILPLPPPSQGLCELSGESFQSYGTYMNTKRAINLDITKEVTIGGGPNIIDPIATISGNGKITISATIDPFGNDVTVTAYIYKQDGSLFDTVLLTAQGQGNYSKPWQGGIEGETYYINLGAIDANGYCASVTITPG